jgi:hypothetical protein
MYESENTFELYPEMTSYENEQFEFGQLEGELEALPTSSHQYF